MLDSSICHVYLQNMKRSEALKLIDETYNKVVQDWLNADINTLEGFNPLNERILKALEQAGMLPPKACIERSVRVGNEERIAYHNTHEWEPEDEKK
jgi:hypothetical protein